MTSQFFSNTSASSNSYAKSMWVACFTHLVVWMISLLALFLIDGITRKKTRVDNPSRPLNAQSATEITSVDVYEKRVTMADRFRRAVRAARLNFLLLFVSTLITVLGYGATHGTSALLWVSFAIGVLWVITDIAVNIPFVRFVYSLALFTLVIIVWALSFRDRTQQDPLIVVS